MWLGSIDAAMFLSAVVDDLIWFFMDGNLDGGYPLIDRCAPAAGSEMSARRRMLWQRPLTSYPSVSVRLSPPRSPSPFSAAGLLNDLIFIFGSQCHSANSIPILSHR
jgi:hypothetical protein